MYSVYNIMQTRDEVKANQLLISEATQVGNGNIKNEN
jgi:hypothetical protein